MKAYVVIHTTKKQEIIGVFLTEKDANHGLEIYLKTRCIVEDNSTYSLQHASEYTIVEVPFDCAIPYKILKDNEEILFFTEGEATEYVNKFITDYICTCGVNFREACIRGSCSHCKYCTMTHCPRCKKRLDYEMYKNICDSMVNGT